MITLDSGKQIDKNLIGKWVGTESNMQTDGVKKEWVFVRFDDGSFNVRIEITTNNKTRILVDMGIWWVENNMYYEFHENTYMIDKYEYEVLNKNQIRFKMVNTEVEFDAVDYEFVDTRLYLLKSGLSLKDAVEINSIQEEYQFVRKYCIGCEYIGQSSLIDEGISYDIIEMLENDHAVVPYYFTKASTSLSKE